MIKYTVMNDEGKYLLRRKNQNYWTENIESAWFTDSINLADVLSVQLHGTLIEVVYSVSSIKKIEFVEK